jgi:Retrotransposon gag protein/Zinc knuckle
MDVDVDPPVYTSGMNVNKPDLYHGDRSKLDDWLMQWDLFFTFQGEKVPEIKRVVLVASYMRGKAFTWIKPFVQQYQAGEAPDDVDVWMRDFDQFKERIKPIFGVSNEPHIARRNIQRIKQDKSAADYAAEFQQLAANTDWDDTALITMFRQGLKPKVKEELMRTGASTETLDELINTAIDIDVRLYELQQELRDDPRARTTIVATNRSAPRNQWHNNLNRGQRGGRNQPNSGRRIHSNTQSGYYGPEAMDLSNLNKGPPPGRWNAKGRGGPHSNREGSKDCYNCGKPGHFARDCRMKNKVLRQLNVLTREDVTADASDWEVVTDEMGRLMEDPESGPEDDDDCIVPPIRAAIPYHGTVDGDEELYPNDSFQYSAIECHKEGKTIHMGKKHYGPFRRQGHRYFNLEGKELLVIERKPEDAAQSQAMCDSIAPPQMGSHVKEQRQRERKRQEQHAKRQSEAVYAQWCKDLVNRENDSEDDNPEIIESTETQEPSWCNKELQRSNERMQRHLQLPTISPRPQYNLDPRNPQHGSITWTACSDDGCLVHYSEKLGEGWFPSRKGLCRNQWYQCLNDLCELHLIDKRDRKYFPGTNDPQQVITMQLVINGKCYNALWQLCLNDECETHRDLKISNGFLEDETFLGQRRRAPGIDPSIASGPIASSNYPSN